MVSEDRETFIEGWEGETLEGTVYLATTYQTVDNAGQGHTQGSRGDEVGRRIQMEKQ